MLKRLTDHILCNNLHEQFQSAYKPNHSTETALMRVQNDILIIIILFISYIIEQQQDVGRGGEGRGGRGGDVISHYLNNNLT